MSIDQSPLAKVANLEVLHDGTTGEYIVVEDGVERARATLHADLGTLLETIAGRETASDLLAQVAKNMGPWT